MVICENVFKSFCTLLLDILRSNSVLVVLVSIDLSMLVVMIFEGRIDHPWWVSNGMRGSYSSRFLMVAA